MKFCICKKMKIIFAKQRQDGGCTTYSTFTFTFTFLYSPRANRQQASAQGGDELLEASVHDAQDGRGGCAHLHLSSERGADPDPGG